MKNNRRDVLHVKKQRVHFRRRADERFGLKIDKQIRAQIIKDIERGRAQLITMQGEGKGLYIVNVGNYTVKVAYNATDREPITVMYMGGYVAKNKRKKINYHQSNYEENRNETF